MTVTEPTPIADATTKVEAAVVAPVSALAAVADRHLDPDWRNWHRWWSIRVAIFWGALSGAYVALPAFYGWVPPPIFALICVGLSVILVVARLFNQPGL